jgi:SAM-dependent methyltransferase
MLWYLLAAGLLGGFGIAVFIGAPYVPILRRDYGPLLELAELMPGQTLIDLGSGDGRLLREVAKRGVYAIGYEINPVLYLVSLVVCWRYRKLVSIKLGDYWHVNLPAADIIYVFLLDKYMARLDRKLTSELSRPTRLVSFVFQVPDKTAVRSSRNTFIYDYPGKSPVLQKSL